MTWTEWPGALQRPVRADGASVTRTLRTGRPLLACQWTRDDRLRWFTAATLVVAVAGPAMAVVGIPPLPIVWPLYRLGIVLPGCGLTRGVVALTRGDFPAAWRWNPASVVVGAFALAGVARLGIGLGTGWWLHLRIGSRWWLIAAACGAVAALWLRQYEHADVLMTDR